MISDTQVKTTPLIDTIANERRFIRDSMNVTDIEGARPQRLRERTKLYNAIDYKDVNGQKKKFVIVKQEVNFDGKGDKRYGNNETIEERVRRLKGFGKKVKQYARSKGNSPANSDMGEDEEVYESSKDKVPKLLNTGNKRLRKNNSDFGRRTEMDKTITKESNNTEHTKKTTARKPKQKENISKRANEETKKPTREEGNRKERMIKQKKNKEEVRTKEKSWEVYEGISDDDIEEIYYDNKQRKDSDYHEENIQDDDYQETRPAKSKKYNNNKQNSGDKESKRKKLVKKKQEDYEEYDIEDEIVNERSRRPNNSNKKTQADEVTSNKHRLHENDEDLQDDSYDEGEVYEINKKSILDKFIFFGKDSRDFFSSKIVNAQPPNAGHSKTTLHKEKLLTNNKHQNQKQHSNNNSPDNQPYYKTAHTKMFKQLNRQNSNKQLHDEEIIEHKHPFLKRNSPKAIPSNKTGFGGTNTRSQEKLPNTKKEERSSSPAFSYYPKTIVSKPLMRRCGGNVKLVYY